jgi:hypothetical protein
MIAMARAGKVGEASWTPNLGRLCLAILLRGGFCLPAQGADRLDGVKNQEVNQILRLQVGGAKVWRTPLALTRISVAAPDIADLILISEREIYILSGEVSGPVAQSAALALVRPDAGGKQDKVVNVPGRLQPETRRGAGAPGYQRRDG